jgi:hypothetical protein
MVQDSPGRTWTRKTGFRIAAVFTPALAPAQRNKGRNHGVLARRGGERYRYHRKDESRRVKGGPGGTTISAADGGRSTQRRLFEGGNHEQDRHPGRRGRAGPVRRRANDGQGRRTGRRGHHEIRDQQAVAAWNVFGAGQTNAPVKDKTVTGGGGVRIKVTTPTPDQPWANGAGQLVDGKIAKSDVITLAFWAKAEPVDGGPATANLSSVGIQQTASPWGSIVAGNVTVTSGEWKLYTVSGRASMDAEKGAAGVGLSLGSAKQTVVLGPLFVLDFGANYDPSMAK